MAAQTGNLGTVGATVILTKAAADTVVYVRLSGTYTGAQVSVQGTWDTIYGNLAGVDVADGTTKSMPVTLADSSTRQLKIPFVSGSTSVQLYCNAITTGTVNVALTSGAYVTDPSLPYAPTVTSVGVSGALTSVAGTLSNGEQVQMGGSTNAATLGVVKGAGVIATAAGNPIAGNAADTTDDILWGVQLPAGLFDAAGRKITIAFQGLAGATANNKRYKVFANATLAGNTITAGIVSGGTASGGTVILDSGTWTSGNNATSFSGSVTITKYGAAASNTQMTGPAETISGATHNGAAAGQALTLTESATVTLVITGSSYTTGAANDLKLQTATVTGAN